MLKNKTVVLIVIFCTFFAIAAFAQNMPKLKTNPPKAEYIRICDPENNKLTIKCQGKACPEAYKEGIVFEAEDTISKKYLNSSVRVPGIRKQALLKASADGEKMTWELGARLCYDKGLMLPSPSILQVAYSFQQNRKPDSCFFKPDYYWTIILPSNYARIIKTSW